MLTANEIIGVLNVKLLDFNIRLEESNYLVQALVARVEREKGYIGSNLIHCGLDTPQERISLLSDSERQLSKVTDNHRKLQKEHNTLIKSIQFIIDRDKKNSL